MNNKPLGLAIEEIAGLEVQDIVGNREAVTMLMHHYSALHSENGALKNDLNSLQTYVLGYESKREDAATAAVLQFFSSLCLAFSVNLLTSDTSKTPDSNAGWFLLLVAVIAQLGGFYYAFRKRSK